jgi:hypothetical protein
VTVPVLPETAAVYWRPRLDAARLRRRGRIWTLTTLAHTLPFLATAALLIALEPLSFPVAAIAVVHAWGIPALYANRGANVVRPRPRAAAAPEGLGAWLVGEAGALLVRPGGRRVDCWCVKVDAELPSADRTAHLLLALREDEEGFATVANLAFSGAPWRLRRRLPAAMRPALDAARRSA